MKSVNKILRPILWLISITLIGCGSSAQVKMDVMPDCPPGKLCHANVKSGVGSFEVGSADSTSLVYTAPERRGEKPAYTVAGFSGVPSATSLTLGVVAPAAIGAAGNIGGAGLIANGMKVAAKATASAAERISASTNATALELNKNQKPSTIFNIQGGNANAGAWNNTNVELQNQIGLQSGGHIKGAPQGDILPAINLGQ